MNTANKAVSSKQFFKDFRLSILQCSKVSVFILLLILCCACSKISQILPKSQPANTAPFHKEAIQHQLEKADSDDDQNGVLHDQHVNSAHNAPKNIPANPNVDIQNQSSGKAEKLISTQQQTSLMASQTDQLDSKLKTTQSQSDQLKLIYKPDLIKSSEIKKLLISEHQGNRRIIILDHFKNIYICKLNQMAKLLCAQVNQKGDQITDFDISPQGNMLALVHNHHQVILFQIKNLIKIQESPAINESITTISFANNLNSILIGTVGGRIYQWHALRDSKESFAELNRYFGHSVSISQLAMHPSNRVFFSLDLQGKLSAWLTYEARPLEYARDSQLFDKNIWTEITQRINKQISTTVQFFRIRSDGKYLLLVLEDGSIQIWSTRGFKFICKQKIQGQRFNRLVAAQDWSKILLVNNIGTSQFMNLSKAQIDIDKNKPNDLNCYAESQSANLQKAPYISSNDLLYSLSGLELKRATITDLQ